MRIVFTDVPAAAPALNAVLEGLTALDAVLLAASERKPSLYEQGVRYEPEPRGQEDWVNVRGVYRRRRGDCEDLAALRAAELRVYEGEPARAVAYPSRRGPGKFHAVVLRADGSIEDPSRLLGMGDKAA